MSLIIYNTLSREKEPFVPLDPSHVRLYVCGPTVYDYVHIGNARPVVAFDVLYRLLKRRYPRVTYVRNITDIDDRIIVRAADNKESIEALTARTGDAYQSDMRRLGALPPDHEPRATEYVAQMVALIGKLVDNGHAYAAEGHVLFSVPSMPDYGRLSRRSRDELIAGARVEVAPYKKDPADFVLWKPSTDQQPGWPSPWGRGRPGWHIECSAMSEAHLGETLDIHAGGNDLMFPHHENEVAQSTCAHGGKVFARWWLHNGMLTFGGKKMSKSLGNTLVLHELLERHPAELLRFMLLKAHYRQPLDWSDATLEQAQRTLDGLYGTLRDLADVDAGEPLLPAALLTALADDLNTPEAMAIVAGLAENARKAAGPAERKSAKAALLGAGAFLGLLQQDPEAWFKHEPGAASVDAAWVECLLAQRADARKRKDYAESDRIRDRLAEAGVMIEDGAQGTRWKLVPKPEAKPDECAV